MVRRSHNAPARDAQMRDCPRRYAAVGGTMYRHRTRRRPRSADDREAPRRAPVALDQPGEITARGKRVAQWKLEPNGLIGQIQQSPVQTASPEEEIESRPYQHLRNPHPQ